MPALKLVKGRKVWKVYCTNGDDSYPRGPRGLFVLYGGKMFATKEAAERLGMCLALRYPDLFGNIVVQEYTVRSVPK